MHFLCVNVTFYEAANIIHDVIRTANPFLYSRLMFVRVKNNKTQKSQTLKDK